MRNSQFERDQRRNAAEDRQKVYDALTLDERIALAKSRPGEAKRELSRLEAQR